MNTRVTQWADELEEIRIELGLDEERYPIALGLAFIEIESGGNDRAHRPGSQFYGLLQQGRAASLDLGWEDRRSKTASRLAGQPLLAIRSWYKIMERYSDRWGYEGAPAHITAAILWKGGAGTARRIRDKIRSEGVSVWEAARWIESHPNKSWRIHNLSKYLRRMERFYPEARGWVEQEYERGQVIEPEPSFHVASSLLELGLRLFEMTRA